MADFIATISSRFRVRNLQAFLDDAAIRSLQSAYENTDNYTDGGFGYFNSTPSPDGTALVDFGGHRGFPAKDEGDGEYWPSAIQRHLASGEHVRVSMAGFDEAFKYTVACAYDITPTHITATDASYGALLGRQWFHTLPEASNNPFAING